ncbi:uncharacterized protein RAG0_01102 [Rhynchosporium agropyri]|uniref:Uncharacterized protein n=1 Tax=Rhynchosporium agropyri TaxID=914238 RepID=A0A1E1JVE2_9HELO|nr:uncharacterized protein RAG0_01102 [Rhynchosporium agropyri]
MSKIPNINDDPYLPKYHSSHPTHIQNSPLSLSLENSNDKRKPTTKKRTPFAEYSTTPSAKHAVFSEMPRNVYRTTRTVTNKTFSVAIACMLIRLAQTDITFTKTPETEELSWHMLSLKAVHCVEWVVSIGTQLSRIPWKTGRR